MQDKNEREQLRQMYQKEDDGDGALREFMDSELSRRSLTVLQTAVVVILTGLGHDEQVTGEFLFEEFLGGH